MMEIRYYGWSGMAVRHAGVEAVFDIPEGAGWIASGAPAHSFFCVTHGHLEHCGSLPGLADRAAPRGVPFRLVSSSPIVEYARKVSGLEFARMRSLAAGEGTEMGGAWIHAFAWKHMSLLPREWFSKVRHLARLASHPLELLHITSRGMKPPRHAPTLGFQVRFPDGRSLLNYSEGLHRYTGEGEVREIARRYPSEILLAAVEPEDVEVLPRWLKILDPKRTLLYEAHRPWREKFGMPCLDLENYAQSLSKRLGGIPVEALTFPGQVARVSARKSRWTGNKVGNMRSR